ncbi:UDP-glucose 4-epimerase GalE [Arcanobacterium bovis]|uniref:UDP-glucose 4-epimerase n=1 Tax=Arcanobacterium bovis TaxID=2529275 RepID=A0A4Q9V044_9ACTO|nr:UDP-glucose 4-epimerase GalE [Arcanobacterium bovis]TBW22017.1 UDP-glucose 4-epimerase GalE [Arcanobacterium bovis]
MAWLVTGGAGYIGAHVVRAFHDAGIDTVVYDDLSTGLRQFVPDGTAFVEGSILDEDLLAKVFETYEITGVMSIAGYKYAGESVKRPLHTYNQNVTGLVSLLSAMHDAGVHNYVFSSSASVYGTPQVDIVTEDCPLSPESPYGQTKFIGEWLAADMKAIDPQWRYTNLRYFNVVGSAGTDVYDRSPHNLFPIVFDRLLAGKTPQINGNDYPTPDGTCVRDYIHVADLAVSHVAAAQALESGKDLLPAYNLGSGEGSSVAEIMHEIATVTGIEFDPIIAPRRPGDPARIVADGHAAARDINWKMRHSLADMVRSAWEARQAQ